MNPVFIAMMLVLIVGVGIYIGFSGITTQYAFDAGRSSAGEIICAPSALTAKPSQAVTFSTSVPEGTLYIWSAPEGTASFVRSGPLTVSYKTAGTKTAYLFVLDGSKWKSATCSVVIK